MARAKVRLSVKASSKWDDDEKDIGLRPIRVKLRTLAEALEGEEIEKIKPLRRWKGCSGRARRFPSPWSATT